MNASMINKYLERIGYEGALAPTKEILFSLHQHHVFNICFENIDIHLGNNISLNIEDVFQKVILNRRGGYCFEVNGLFGSVLEFVGFDVQYCGSRVWYGYDPENGMRPRAHQMLIVTIEGSEYLVDVSFGNGFFLPLSLENDEYQEQFGRKFCARPNAELGTKVFMLNDGDPLLLFSFTRETCFPPDYEVASYYASNHENSLFTQKLVCTLPSERGRKIIVDKEYSEIINGTRTTILIDSNTQLLEILEREFSITFDTNVLFPLFQSESKNVI